jgi:hypothetical protein
MARAVSALAGPSRIQRAARDMGRPAVWRSLPETNGDHDAMTDQEPNPTGLAVARMFGRCLGYFTKGFTTMWFFAGAIFATYLIIAVITLLIVRIT